MSDEGKEAILEVNKINSFYGDIHVLWDVSFKVFKGEIATIIGPNGAGKTTTLRTISGILKPKSGTITFQGKRIDGMNPYDIVNLGVVHIPEGGRLFPGMTVLENLLMGAYTKRAREKVEESLEEVYNLFPLLKERKNQKAGTLSGGERQMVAIARGLMARPILLMLDEPSLGLAPKFVMKTFEAVKKINEREGVTILIVEQNIYSVLQIATRGYVLETGRIVLEGTSKELLENEHVKKTYLGI